MGHLNDRTFQLMLFSKTDLLVVFLSAEFYPSYRKSDQLDLFWDYWSKNDWILSRSRAKQTKGSEKIACKSL